MALLSIPYCNYTLSVKANLQSQVSHLPITPIASKKKGNESTNESIDQQSKPDYRDVVIQNSPDCKEAAVQTHGEAAAAAAAEITGKLELYSVMYSWIWQPSEAYTYVSCPGFSMSNLTAEMHTLEFSEGNHLVACFQHT